MFAGWEGWERPMRWRVLLRTVCWKSPMINRVSCWLMVLRSLIRARRSYLRYLGLLCWRGGVGFTVGVYVEVMWVVWPCWKAYIPMTAVWSPLSPLKMKTCKRPAWLERCAVGANVGVTVWFDVYYISSLVSSASKREVHFRARGQICPEI